MISFYIISKSQYSAQLKYVGKRRIIEDVRPFLLKFNNTKCSLESRRIFIIKFQGLILVFKMS